MTCRHAHHERSDGLRRAANTLWSRGPAVCCVGRYTVSDRSFWQGPGTPLRYNSNGTLTVYLSTRRPPSSKQVRALLLRYLTKGKVFILLTSVYPLI